MKKSFSLYAIVMGVLIVIVLLAIIAIFAVGCTFSLGLAV